jgi:hypothetical protein
MTHDLRDLLQALPPAQLPFAGDRCDQVWRRARRARAMRLTASAATAAGVAVIVFGVVYTAGGNGQRGLQVSGNAPEPTPAVGTVQGTVRGVGGPAPGSTFTPSPGATVDLVLNGQVITSTVTDASGNYSLHAEPGSYDISAEAFGGTCEGGTVTVTADSTTTRPVVCPIP